MEITKREVIFSVVIVSFLTIIGFMISNKIYKKQQDKNLRYTTAIQIDNNPDQFNYAIDTEIGNVLAYGTVKTIEPVSTSIVGNSMYIKRDLEKYTMHTRTVHYTVNGKSHTRIEHYWTWDHQKTDNFYANETSFLNRDFNTHFWVNLISTEYIGTESCGYHLRYSYSRIPIEVTGTLYTNIFDGKYNDSEFKRNTTIHTAVDEFSIGWYLPVFWTIWIIITIVCVIGFYYIDNNWLE